MRRLQRKGRTVKANGAAGHRPARTRGAQELANIVAGGVDQIEVARACATNKSSVSRWLSGERKPTIENRAVLKSRYKIKLASWAEPEHEDAAAEAPKEDLEVIAAETLREQADKLRIEVVRARNVLIATKSTPDERRRAAEQIKSASNAANFLIRLGKITGETKDLTEAQLVKTPAWSRLCTELLKVLAPWPEAMLAVGHALRSYDLEGR